MKRYFFVITILLTAWLTPVKAFYDPASADLRLYQLDNPYALICSSMHSVGLPSAGCGPISPLEWATVYRPVMVVPADNPQATPVIYPKQPQQTSFISLVNDLLRFVMGIHY